MYLKLIITLKTKFNSIRQGRSIHRAKLNMKAIVILIFFAQIMKCEWHLQTGHVERAVNFVLVVSTYHFVAMFVNNHEFCSQESWIIPDPKDHFIYAVVPCLWGSQLKSPVKRRDSFSFANQGMAWSRNNPWKPLQAWYWQRNNKESA